MEWVAWRVRGAEHVAEILEFRRVLGTAEARQQRPHVQRECGQSREDGPPRLVSSAGWSGRGISQDAAAQRHLPSVSLLSLIGSRPRAPGSGPVTLPRLADPRRLCRRITRLSRAALAASGTSPRVGAPIPLLSLIGSRPRAPGPGPVTLPRPAGPRRRVKPYALPRLSDFPPGGRVSWSPDGRYLAAARAPIHTGRSRVSIVCGSRSPEARHGKSWGV